MAVKGAGKLLHECCQGRRLSGMDLDLIRSSVTNSSLPEKSWPRSIPEVLCNFGQGTQGNLTSMSQTDYLAARSSAARL